MIILPQSDVVIKMALKAFCKIKTKKKRKKKNTPKRLLKRHAVYMWGLLEFQRELSDLRPERLRTGIGFHDLFWNYCALHFIITLKHLWQEIISHVNHSNNNLY